MSSHVIICHQYSLKNHIPPLLSSFLSWQTPLFRPETSCLCLPPTASRSVGGLPSPSPRCGSRRVRGTELGTWHPSPGEWGNTEWPDRSLRSSGPRTGGPRREFTRGVPTPRTMRKCWRKQLKFQARRPMAPRKRCVRWCQQNRRVSQEMQEMPFSSF